MTGGGAGAGIGTDGGFDCAACATGRCQADAGVCAECLPSNDQCPTGKYCGASFTCVVGCKNNAGCESQRCLPSHDCFECLSDSECGEGRLCGTGVCSPPCTGNTSPDGGACCSGRAVELARDDAHCGSCTTACSATQFCTGTACAPLALSSVCSTPVANVLYDGLSIDDQVAASLGTTLSSVCSPGLTVNAWPSNDAGVLLNTTTGQPWAHGGALFAIAGGPFGQKLVGYLERSAVSEVKFSSNATDNVLMRQSGAVLVQAPFGQTSATHDWFVLELVKQPSRGSPSLVAYGFGPQGTMAAQYYLQTQIIPSLNTFTKAWYVIEWTDGAAVGVGAGDTFTLVASGP